ncbi:dihydrodipicolinate synthase family protein [Candidatus Bathyarchaeota archaeon]|nr:dihydrodipicolinate synthase family protein [Candidatus Bathyarchaeota archaeon]
MPKLKLEGIFVPAITPFTKTGKINLEALRACAKFWMENGVNGLMPCGSNGEAHLLNFKAAAAASNIKDTPTY